MTLRVRTPEQKARLAVTNRALAKRRVKELNAYGAQWRLNNPDKRALAVLKQNLKRRGIPVDMAKLPPRPAVCSIPDCSGTKIVFDHCHKTNAFRGWICHGCNTALGHAKDDPDRLRKLADYVEAHS